MQQEVEKMAREIVLKLFKDIAKDIDYLDVCELVAEDSRVNALTESEFEMLCDQVDAKIREAKVIVKFGR